MERCQNINEMRLKNWTNVQKSAVEIEKISWKIFLRWFWTCLTFIQLEKRWLLTKTRHIMNAVKGSIFLG